MHLILYIFGGRVGKRGPLLRSENSVCSCIYIYMAWHPTGAYQKNFNTLLLPSKKRFCYNISRNTAKRYRKIYVFGKLSTRSERKICFCVVLMPIQEVIAEYFPKCFLIVQFFWFFLFFCFLYKKLKKEKYFFIV